MQGTEVSDTSFPCFHSIPRPHHPSRSLIGRSRAQGTPLAEQAEVTRASWSYTFAPLIRDLKEAAGTRSRNLIISNQDLQVNLCRTVHRGPLKISDVASKHVFFKNTH